jgi:hypothetical protein
MKAREKGSGLKNEWSILNVALNPEGFATFQETESGKRAYKFII